MCVRSEREIFIYNGNKFGEVEKLHLILGKIPLFLIPSRHLAWEPTTFPGRLAPKIRAPSFLEAVGVQNRKKTTEPESWKENRSCAARGRKSRGKTGHQPLLQCHASQRAGSRAERARARGGGGDPRQRFPATGKPPRVQVGSPARLRELPRAGADLLVGSATVMTSAMMSAPLNGLFH